MRSLQGRLLAVLLLLVGAAIASATVMLTLYNQSTSARIGQASAVLGRSCGAIGQSYRFYTAGWNGASAPNDDALRSALSAVVFTALRDRADVEGGLWQPNVGVFAYAYPTYEGTGPKTDVPQAELPMIGAVNRSVLAEDRLLVQRVDARSQTLLIAGCPLPGPLIGLTAWTMTRVHVVGTPMYWQLLGGLSALVLAVVAASVVVLNLLANWSRHVRRIEMALARPAGDLPVLHPTGERELDRIVTTINDAGQHLRTTRLEAERLSRAVARSEQLAAVGQVAAGVAHEIRSPIAAMRLKAEMALARSPDRKDQALRVVIEQVDRLDGFVARLLAVSEREWPVEEEVDLIRFLHGCAAAARRDTARTDTVIECVARVATARFDPNQMQRAIGCLLANAQEADPTGPIVLEAEQQDGALSLSVTDRGPGPPDAIRDHLFDPFVSGRPQGAGLGLSIAREIAEAHEGVADFRRVGDASIFRIVIPCPAS